MDFILLGTKVAGLLTKYWPTNKINLERIEYLQERIDDDNLKLYLEQKRNRILFLMSTGLAYNALNVILFERFATHPELLSRFNPRIAQYFRMKGSEIQMKKKWKIGFNILLIDSYYIILFLLSVLWVVVTTLKYMDSHNVYLVASSIVVWVIVSLVGLIKAGNKWQDIRILKLYEERYKNC